MTDTILFEIYGFKIRANTLYEVTEKLDTSAPDGFKEFKTTKALHPDISNTEPGAVFDGELGVWDTGLYSNSRALVKAIPSDSEREKLVKDIIKNISTPLEKLRGKNFLSQFSDNNEFWDNYRIDIKKGTIFNTAKPEDLLKLYLAVLHMFVTPKNLESHPEWKNTQYCIIDKEDVVDRKMEHEMDLMKASATFFNLLSSSKKEDLMLILDYLKMGVSEKTEDKVLTSLFNTWIKDKSDGYQNAKIFIKTYEYFKTDEGEKEMFYHSKIKSLHKKNIIKFKQKEIWFEDEFIGADLKSATRNIIANSDLESRFLKHIE